MTVSAKVENIKGWIPYTVATVNSTAFNVDFDSRSAAAWPLASVPTHGTFRVRHTVVWSRTGDKNYNRTIDLYSTWTFTTNTLNFMYADTVIGTWGTELGTPTVSASGANMRLAFPTGSATDKTGFISVFCTIMAAQETTDA